MSAFAFDLGKQRLADLVARSALRAPILEKIVALGCRSPRLRKLGLGAVAHGYSRVLQRREMRVASFVDYCLWVNVAEPLGIEPFFFGQPGTVWLTPMLVRAGDVCVDAGANVGHYTFHMASIVGSSGRVFAFEANTQLVETLRQSVSLNGYGSFVEAVPNALWSVAGEEMTFYVSVESSNSGTSSLVDHGWFLSRENTIRVTTTTLDEFARARSLDRFRLVKLDVERAEEQVLRGAEGLLRESKIDYLIVELVSRAEAVRILEQHGYVGYVLDAARHRLSSLAAVPADTYCDALFVSAPEHAAFLARFGASIE